MARAVAAGRVLVGQGGQVVTAPVNASGMARPGAVLVVGTLEARCFDAMVGAAAVVCAEGGRTGHLQSICRARGIPIVQVDRRDLAVLRQWQQVAIDLATGTVAMGAAEAVGAGAADTARAGELVGERTDLLVVASVDDICRVNCTDAAAGVSAFFFREEFGWVARTINPLGLLQQGRIEEYANLVTDIIETMTAALLPHQSLVFRLLDLRSDAADELDGSRPDHRATRSGGVGEANPELGMHGCRWIATSVPYARAARRFVERAKPTVSFALPFLNDRAEFDDVEAHLDLPGRPPLAVFVETPAAVLSLADLLGGNVAHVLVGTKDLVQFVLAADRGNRRVAHCYDTRHRAVLTLVESVVHTCDAAGVACSVFALAADLAFYADQLPPNTRLMLCAGEYLNLLESSDVHSAR